MATTSKLTERKKSTSHANRGMKFEAMIQKQCDKYKEEGIAYIDKLPTEFKVQRGVSGQIVKAFPVGKSKLDFYGTLANGQSIYIEAKSTKDNSFPLGNFKEHQFVYLKELKEYTDHVYILIEMKKHEKTFIVLGDKILSFRETETRKSLPLDWLEENGIALDNLDFLKTIVLG